MYETAGTSRGGGNGEKVEGERGSENCKGLVGMGKIY